MYKIDMSANTVVKIEQRLFRDLNIREREHLQEWIAKNPDMLGESLLVIQKEFDGFNDTNERLDLLALDKDGNLVIIENKLDDTGRDVVWQALKYTSYCSTLTTEQIITLYQKYLDKWFIGEDAKQNLLDFLDIGDDNLLLNSNDQRIMFVANNYRKEVTSTVLWLLQHNVQIQCFRATPYSSGNDVFLQVEQIIPVPETKEYMIDIKEKQEDEQKKSKKAQESEERVLRFWKILKNALTENNLDYLNNVSARPTHDIGFWKGVGMFRFCIGRKSFRVELHFRHDSDKKCIDTMKRYEDVIHRSFNGTLQWERLDDKVVSRIKYEMSEEEIKHLETKGTFEDEIYWDDVIQWYCVSMKRFYAAVNPVWEKVQREI